MCNMPDYLMQRIVRCEKRVFKIIGTTDNFPRVNKVAEGICEKLFAGVLSCDSHSLREMFLTRHFKSRNNCHLRPPFTKTKRFKESFIKFCE